MRLLVCGGRDFADTPALSAALDRVHAKRPITALIEGGATGADRLAREWALGRGIRICTFFADWGAHGRAAGPFRNAAMLAEGKPDGVVAFPRANGRMGPGTADMVRRACEAGVPVWEPLSGVVHAGRGDVSGAGLASGACVGTTGVGMGAAGLGVGDGR